MSYHNYSNFDILKNLRGNFSFSSVGRTIEEELAIRRLIQRALDRETPVLFVLKKGTPKETIRTLIQCGALVNEQNGDGDTPLHIAARNSDLEFMEVLIAAGADTKIKNYKQQTPLHDAGVSATRLLMHAEYLQNNGEAKRILEA
jgi:ankyrin repeat protein